MLDQVLSFLADYGAVVVFTGIFLESSGLPIPGESLLIAAGVLASQGELDFSSVFLAAFVGGMLGDNVGYVIGRRYGRRFVYRYGARVGLPKARILVIERRFRERGPPIVLVARFILVLRQLCGFIAGTARMPWWEFSFYNAVGAGLWAGVYCGGAYILGAAVEEYLAAGHWVFAGVALVFLVASGTTLYGFFCEARGADEDTAEVPDLPKVGRPEAGGPSS